MMAGTTDLSRAGRDSLLFSNIDLDETDWMDHYENDIIFVHHPRFKFSHKEPYKFRQLLPSVQID